MIDFESNQQHEVSELICLNCHYRYIGVYPTKTLLKELECNQCGKVGYIIKTGQTIEENESETECKSCQLYDNGKCKLGLQNSEEYYCGYYKKNKEVEE